MPSIYYKLNKSFPIRSLRYDRMGVPSKEASTIDVPSPRGKNLMCNPCLLPTPCYSALNLHGL